MPTARTRKTLFDPASKEPFPLSRSGVESWVSCPRCFWMHKRLGLRPPGPPAMMLNRAVDELLKKEFDQYRAKAIPHPVMQEHGIDAVPFSHPDLAVWRSSFRGIRLLHEPTNFLLSGAPDDIWVAPDGELFVADYKGTASAKDDPQNLDADYRQAYKRQLEFYQFLLIGNGFKVSRRCFIVYAVGVMSAPSLDGRLSFRLELIEHLANMDWIEPTLNKIRECLMLDEAPAPAADCELCSYVAAVNDAAKGTT
jgi:RecB family exonuclease